MIDDARAFSADERKKLASKGHAMPDGSFPIVSVQDLKNAISAYGRAKNKAAAKRHIIKRARALGQTKLLPESWKSDTSEESAMNCTLCDRAFIDQAQLDDHAESVHTHDDIRQSLRVAVREKVGRSSWVVDVSDDWFVYDKEESDIFKLYRQSYLMDDQGNVTLVGSPVEVVRRTAYIPSPSVEAAMEEMAKSDIAVRALKGGSNIADIPHGFSGEFSAAVFCTVCGRHQIHPLHD